MIPFENVSEICVGTDAADEVEFAVDENSVTLILDDGQAIGFGFDNSEEREAFALCLSMFVEGRRNEMETGKKK